MSHRPKVDEIRQRLEELDRELLRTIERRARLATDLLKATGEGGRLAPITAPDKLAELEQAVTPPFPASAVRPLFAAIDAACRYFEVAPRVACVGPEGGFAHQAAAVHFGPLAELLRAETPELALEEVSRGQADFAIVTLETVRDGLAFSTIQSIAALDLRLVGEREVAHSLRLVGRRPALDRVERIYASAQHHALSERFLSEAAPRATILHVRSPVLALELALEHDDSAAVVPSGLPLPASIESLRESIADEGPIRVRHGIVARSPSSRTGHDATAVLFSVTDKPGALHDVLQSFKERSCNLRRIQSRAVPSEGWGSSEGWEYVFYVEVSGHVTDRPLVAALEGVKQRARLVKVIGSFPVEVSEGASSSDGRSGRHG